MPEKDKAVAYAERVGKEHGRNAVDWWSQDHLGGGRDTRRQADVRYEARALLRGIEDGDLMILDSIPHPDLSGEWADSLTGPQLVADAIADAGLRHSVASTLTWSPPGGEPVATTDVLDPWPHGHAPGTCPVCDWWDASGTIHDAYEVAFSQAVEAEVARLAKAALR